MDILLIIVFAVAGFLLGTFGWSQIIGSIQAKSTAKEFSFNDPRFFSAQFLAKRYSFPLILWAVILAVTFCITVFVFPNYWIPFIAGLALSLGMSLKSLPSLAKEFLENVEALANTYSNNK